MLAIVLLMVTIIAVWARATVFNGEKVAGFVGDALDEPEVEAALAAFISEQVFAAVDVDAVITEVLPAQLQRLEPVIASGAQTVVERGMTRVLSNPDVQNIITELVERAHRRDAAARRRWAGRRHHRRRRRGHA